MTILSIKGLAIVRLFGGGTKDTSHYTPLIPISFTFMQYWQKNFQMIDWHARSPVWKILDPLLFWDNLLHSISFCEAKNRDFINEVVLYRVNNYYCDAMLLHAPVPSQLKITLVEMVKDFVTQVGFKSKCWRHCHFYIFNFWIPMKKISKSKRTNQERH